MSMLEMLEQMLGGAEVKELSAQLGADEGTTQKAVGAALPTLLAALQKNAAKPGGAEALHNALSRDHDGSVLSDVSGYLRGGDSGAGDGILGHVLGNRRPQVERSLITVSGHDRQKVGQVAADLRALRKPDVYKHKGIRYQGEHLRKKAGKTAVK